MKKFKARQTSIEPQSTYPKTIKDQWEVIMSKSVNTLKEN